MSESEPQAITPKTCTRCGATWYPRTPGRPVGCAKCHSPYWDKPRVYKLKDKTPARSRAGATPATATTEPPAVIEGQADPGPVSLAGGVRAASVLESYRSLKQGE